MAVAWVFPGQGSQRRGMGTEVFDRFPDLCAQADEILGYSLSELCLRDVRRLRDTRYAQPALFAVNTLSYLARCEDKAERPDFLAGHSLGEYAALFAAGCLDFETGLRLVKKRGELMAQATGGTMTAVLGMPEDRLEVLLKSVPEVDVANYNSPEQIVLAGSKDAIRAAVEVIQPEGKCVPLSVSVASHSRHMRGAAAAFGDVLEGVEFAEPKVPVISNVTARPHRAAELAGLLQEQVDHPVRWLDGMRYLIGQGVDELVEVGPGDVLTKLWKRIGESTPRAGSADPRTVPAQRTASAGTPVESTGRTISTGTPVEQTDRTEPAARSKMAPDRLGSADFRRDYGVRYAYLSGAMFKGIASTDLVVRMARAGLMGFFGAGGLTLAEIEEAIGVIRKELGPEANFGMNLLFGLGDDGLERDTVDLYLREDVRYVEAAAYVQMTAPLVRFRFTGAHRDRGGRPVALRHVMAKVSRPEVAAAFMRPPAGALLDKLVQEGALSRAEAEIAGELPISEDICVEADSAGHTDGRSAYALMPAMLSLRDEEMARHGYAKPIRIGASGGLGAPEAVAAAFILGAEFVITGSVNQCSPEAGTSDAVKEMLAGLDVQDTAYAPAGDMFELGAKVQVARKGTLFPARANKLYQLYRRYGSLEEIDEATRRMIEEKYFGRSFDEVWAETRDYLAERKAYELERAEQNPKHRMALIFRWYFVHSIRLAMRGAPGQEVDYQVHCGPAMGAFNRFVAGTDLADWRNRHVDVIAERLMHGAADLLDARFQAMLATPAK
ncbi:ACP S-malonyltransferase [Streptosporangium subroseum]|uniref:ACP S-malonyltransferase n=1 Tax=Streptosporangium subroseum TaxID=106412 RepID=UPI00343529DB